MIKEKLADDLKQAMKDRNEVVVSTLRMVLSAVKNKEIDKHGELNDEEVLKILSGEKKKHLDSIAQFTTGGRDDLVAKEKAETVIIESYLPASMPAAEIQKLVVKAVAEVGADFGKIMKAVMSAAGGQADGSVVSQMVKKTLTQKT